MLFLAPMWWNGRRGRFKICSEQSGVGSSPIIGNMKWIDRFDLFLLDLDGLLVNTEPLHFEAYRLLCRRRGFELPWTFERYCGFAHSSAEGLKTALFEELPSLKEMEPRWEVLYSEKKCHYLGLLQGESLQLMPGVKAFLMELALAARKRCVATNATSEQVEEMKRQLPSLGSIPVWITREQYENPKPAPDAYLKAKELLADPGDQIIGFEDTLKGVKALEAAGVAPILICQKNHPQLLEGALHGVKHFESFEGFIQLKNYL